MTDKFQTYAAIFQILNRAMLSSIPDNGWNTGLRLYEIIYFRFLSCRFVNQILSQFQPFDKHFFQDFVICTFFIWTTFS